MLSMLCLVLVAANSLEVFGARMRTPQPPLQSMHLATLPMSLYRQDCGKRQVMALDQQTKAALPGAGTEPATYTPFGTVLKDGFFEVGCFKDFMYLHGDKFGDNKFSYEVGAVSNVSIVHYNQLVVRQDRLPITHEVCFSFCRTLPDMMFFGFVNGRDCYCAPYYQPMAGDSSMCDAVCDGDSSTMCGGKSKSSIFAMHACENTATDLSETATKLSGIMAKLTTLIGTISEETKPWGGVATTYLTAFSKAGDPVAADLMQSVKALGGKSSSAVDSATALVLSMRKLLLTNVGRDFQQFDIAEEAEGHIADMEAKVAEAEAKYEELAKFFEEIHPETEGADAGKEYYPITYFVDKEFEHVPSTCGGTVIGNPIGGKSFDVCARACDTKFRDCVGFSFFKGTDNLCFLFSKFTSTTYYTGCSTDKGFLQRALQTVNIAKKEESGSQTVCVAKLEDFVGTTLKPDPSGKCEMCLKKATKADRCFE